MDLNLWKLTVRILLVIVKSFFASPVVLTFLVSIFMSFFLLNPSMTVPSFFPENFSFNEIDLLRWWGYAFIIGTFLQLILRKIFPNTNPMDLISKFIICFIVFTICYTIFIISLARLDLAPGVILWAYVFWYVLMIIFMAISFVIDRIIQKVEKL